MNVQSTIHHLIFKPNNGLFNNLTIQALVQMRGSVGSMYSLYSAVSNFWTDLSCFSYILDRIYGLFGLILSDQAQAALFTFVDFKSYVTEKLNKVVTYLKQEHPNRAMTSTGWMTHSRKRSNSNFNMFGTHSPAPVCELALLCIRL